MIDPKNSIKYDRTTRELQEFFIFCICAANKPAYITAKKVGEFLMFLGLQDGAHTPFGLIRTVGMDGVSVALGKARMGQYVRISKALIQAAALDLRTCTLDELMAIPGVGPKTARYFLLYSRKDTEYAVLDPHVLKWLRDLGVPNVPATTPQNRSAYGRLEKLYINLAREIGKPLPDLDLEIWARYKGLSTA